MNRREKSQDAAEQNVADPDRHGARDLPDQSAEVGLETNAEQQHDNTRVGEELEERLAREEATARAAHARALSGGREPTAAAERFARAVARLEEATLAKA